MGAGRARILEAIFGNETFKCRSLKVDGKPASIRNPNMAIKAGLAYIPSERKNDGLILIHTVIENISIAALSLFMKFKVFLNHAKEAKTAKEWISRMSIKTPSLTTSVENLSGGNQQKVVLAKWMMTDPKVLFMNEPTRGIDVGAKIEVYKLMGEFCRNGLGIVLISSELPEIMAIADRILTIQAGKITGEFSRNEFDQESLLSAALGE
jgi:ABC-type sugar transport system ATPase subunit